jgi:hypothetical protein
VNGAALPKGGLALAAFLDNLLRDTGDGPVSHRHQAGGLQGTDGEEASGQRDGGHCLFDTHVESP